MLASKFSKAALNTVATSVRSVAPRGCAANYHSLSEGHLHQSKHDENFDLKGSSLFDSHRHFQSTNAATSASPDLYDLIMQSYSPVSISDCYQVSKEPEKLMSHDSIRDIMAAQEEWDRLHEDVAFELMKEDPFMADMEDNWVQFHKDHDITHFRGTGGDKDIDEDCIQACIH